MKRRPDAIGFEAMANYAASVLPDFSKMSEDDQRRSRSALRITASYVQALRAELGDACPSCGSVVGEGVAHG